MTRANRKTRDAVERAEAEAAPRGRSLHPALRPRSWPLPADAGRAALGRERWLERAAEAEEPEVRRFARRLTQSKSGQALLDAAFGNSPFLADLLIAEQRFAAELLAAGPDASFARIMAELRAEAEAPADTAALMRALRIAKRRAALATALADIADAWPLERVTGALSELADTALVLAVRQLLREAAASGVFVPRDTQRPDLGSGFVVLGMGKLGAFELNYSSDIDLIVLYDTERIRTDAPAQLQHGFVRLTRSLVRIFEERTAEGYVFRTDLRLRPDPGSTPLALSMYAAETYYESMGQNWERAAMIKARPVAGDLDAGRDFLARLRPYVWRRSLDFAAIQDIHSIKRQINAHRGGGSVQIAGHNIKLGRGGIREIEFFVQTQQLIRGGREPALRTSSTLGALEALAAIGRIDRETVEALGGAYRFLRRVEHRLQMIDDKQTHTLPEAEAELDALAIFLGHPDGASFAEAMLAQLRAVERHYVELFEDAPSLGGPGNLVFTGTEDDPSTIETLRSMGFSDPQHVSATIRGWHHGRYRAMRSARARELLTEITPRLLLALSKTPDPAVTFMRFDAFLGRLPAGVQLFSLFHANPGLLDLVAEIMGSAPRLAETLSGRPALLDAVLAPQFFDKLPPADALAADLLHTLGQAWDFQDVPDMTRRWTNERKFQIGVQLLRGRSSVQAAGAALSDIAEIVLSALQPSVEAEFAQQHGHVPGSSMAIVALGKLGGREMTVTSDLDLIFIYDLPPGVEASNGPKPLPVTLYYTRLGARLINALTALTGEGRLYEIDMRLRPSGNKGPIAVSLDGFAAYQRDNAWTWEHMALTRARPVTGGAQLRARIAATIRAVLAGPRDPTKLAADVAEMRQRMAREIVARSPWDIKHWRGGLIDVEFVAQYLQLRHAAERPQILHQNTDAALAAAIAAGVIGERDGRALREALALWQSVQGMLRLTVEGELDEAAAPPALKAALARAARAIDFDDLKSTMRRRAAAVHRLFETMLPLPAAAPQDATQTERKR